MTSLLTAVTRDWPGLTDAPLDRARARLMKASSRPGANLPLVFFVFEAGAREPAYVLKVNRNPEWPTGILQEHRNYSAIHARLTGGGLRVPRPLFCRTVGRHVVLGETYLPGHRLEDRFFSTRRGWGRRRAIEGFLVKAMAWLQDFHGQTRVQTRVVDRACLEEEFERPLVRFGQQPDLSRALRDGLGRYERGLEGLLGARWPLTAVHGDFDHGNILLDGDHIGVVDWEDCQPAGNPFVDLAYLVFDLALVSDLRVGRARRLAAFFREGGWTAGLVHRLLDDYARAAGIESDTFFLALPRMVVTILDREHGPGRDPRSIPLCSREMLEFTLELSGRRGWGRP